MNGRLGQIAVWIVVAIIIVGTIILFFMLRNPTKVNNPTDSNPLDANAYVGSCLSEQTNYALDKMLPQGGFVNPTNYLDYDSGKVEYVASHTGMFANEIKTEIEIYLALNANICFENLKKEARKYNTAIEIDSGGNYVVELMAEKIIVKISKPTKITTKDGQVKEFKDYSVEIDSVIYNLAIIAIEVPMIEENSCGASGSYDRYSLSFVPVGDSKVYIITDSKTQTNMNVAVKKCSAELVV